MAQLEPPNHGGRNSGFVNGLWLAAAITVVAGFILRSLSSFLGRGDLRFGGIALIAAGLAMAGLGWVADRIRTRKAR
jgi:hypothetical protein